jgi:hypothetical protein
LLDGGSKINPLSKLRIVPFAGKAQFGFAVSLYSFDIPETFGRNRRSVPMIHQTDRPSPSPESEDAEFRLEGLKPIKIHRPT